MDLQTALNVFLLIGFAVVGFAFLQLRSSYMELRDAYASLRDYHARSIDRLQKDLWGVASEMRSGFEALDLHYTPARPAQPNTWSKK